MALIPRKVKNLRSAQMEIRVPGDDPNKLIVLPSNVVVDLLSQVSVDDLLVMQKQLQSIVDSGAVQLVESMDSNDAHSSVDPVDLVKAIEGMHKCKAERRSLVGLKDATDLQSALALVNELKRIVNLMNTKNI